MMYNQEILGPLPGWLQTLHTTLQAKLPRVKEEGVQSILCTMKTELRAVRNDSHFEHLPKSARWAISRVHDAVLWTPKEEVSHLMLLNAVHCIGMAAHYEWVTDRQQDFDTAALSLMLMGWTLFPPPVDDRPELQRRNAHQDPDDMLIGDVPRGHPR